MSVVYTFLVCPMKVRNALWITFGLLFGLTIVKVSTLMYEIYSFMQSLRISS